MKIITTNSLIKTPWLEFNETEFENRVGEKKKYNWVHRTSGTNAVHIVATVRDRLVLLREYRIPINDYEWSFPGGLIDGQEDVVDAAKRELYEETGLNITNVLDKSPFVYNTAGLSDEASCLVYVEAHGTPTTSLQEDSEDIEIWLLDKIQVAKLLKADIKIGAKSYIIMRHFAKTGKTI